MDWSGQLHGDIRHCEAATANLVSLWFVGGSAGGPDYRTAGGSIWVQLAVFLVVSGILLALLRPFARRFVTPRRIATNADMALGKEAYVTETVDNLRETGAVKLDGKVWTAVPSPARSFPPER